MTAKKIFELKINDKHTRGIAVTTLISASSLYLFLLGGSLLVLAEYFNAFTTIPIIIIVPCIIAGLAIISCSIAIYVKDTRSCYSQEKRRGD
jgi:hypothetical protein